MSVPPETLRRAPLYLLSMARIRRIISCCDVVRSSSGIIVMLKLPLPFPTYCCTRLNSPVGFASERSSESTSFSTGLTNSSVRA